MVFEAYTENIIKKTLKDMQKKKLKN